MFYGRENANYIHANRYPVAAAQNLPQQLAIENNWKFKYTNSIKNKNRLSKSTSPGTTWCSGSGPLLHILRGSLAPPGLNLLPVWPGAVPYPQNCFHPAPDQPSLWAFSAAGFRALDGGFKDENRYGGWCFHKNTHKKSSHLRIFAVLGFNGEQKSDCGCGCGLFFGVELALPSDCTRPN